MNVMKSLTNKQKGMLCIVLSALSFACMNVCVKMSGNIPSVEKAFFRNFIASFISGYTIIKSGVGLHYKKEAFPYLFLRAACGTVGMLANFYAVDHLLLADASTIQKLVPFITIVTSYFILKEKVTSKQMLLVVCAFLSSLLVVKPTFSNINLFPSLIALIGAVGAGIAYTMVRICTQKGEEKSRIIFFFSVFSCVVTIPFIIPIFVLPSKTQLILLILTGVFASGGQFAVTYAYSFAPANQISVMDYSQIIISAILGYIFFKQVSDIYSYIGYVFIIGIAVINYLYTNKLEKKKIIIGTRGSKLALVQTELVKEAILKEDKNLEVEIKVISTKGDINQKDAISSIGENGVFTSTIEEALLHKEIDIAVHSLKDVPSQIHPDLTFIGTIQAEDPRDCLVFKQGYHSLNDLPQNAIIATCSKRREHLIKALRPDLKIVGIRGNIDTRLKKLETENIDATILAVAGLNRINKQDVIGEYLSVNQMIPSPTQGILGIETRKDANINVLINRMIDLASTRRMHLERLYLSTINGSCKDAIGCYIEEKDEGIMMHAMYGDDKHYEVIHRYIENNIEENVVEIAKELKNKIHE